MRQDTNWFKTPHNVLEDAKYIALPLSAQMLYIHLCRLKNKISQERFYRNMPTLIKETGMSERTLQRAKKVLLKAEYIGIERDAYKANGHRKADIYHLNGFSYKLD